MGNLIKLDSERKGTLSFYKKRIINSSPCESCNNYHEKVTKIFCDFLDSGDLDYLNGLRDVRDDIKKSRDILGYEALDAIGPACDKCLTPGMISNIEILELMDDYVVRVDEFIKNDYTMEDLEGLASKCHMDLGIFLV